MLIINTILYLRVVVVIAPLGKMFLDYNVLKLFLFYQSLKLIFKLFYEKLERYHTKGKVRPGIKTFGLSRIATQ